MFCRLLLILVAGLQIGCHQPVQTSDEELLQLAKVGLKSETPSSALPQLEALLERQPRHPEALLFRAQLARDAGNDLEALGYVRKVPTDQGPVSGTASYLEGSILVGRGQGQAAETAFRRAIQLNPKFKPARLALIELFFLQLRGPEARDALRDLRPSHGWGLAQYVQYQLALTDLIRPEGSRELLRQFVKNDTGELHNLVALVRDELTANALPDALTVLRTTPLIDSERETIQGLTIETLVRQGDIVAARQIAREMTPRTSSSVWRWRGLAVLADAESEWSVAAAAWWNVVRLMPDDRNANYRLAVALDRTGHKDSAQQQFQRTRQLELYLDHVTHIMAGDTSKSHLVAKMAAKIVELLFELNRPEDARLWLDYLSVIAPDYPSGGELLSRLDASALRKEPPHLSIEFGQQLMAALPARADSLPQNLPNATIVPLPSFAMAPITIEDHHQSAGISFQHFNGPSKFKYLLESLGGGVSVLDFDGDGWPDLYFPQGCSLPYVSADVTHTDRLYRNLGNGTFRDVTEYTAILENRYSQGAATADFDNDGFPDVVVANYGRNSFFRNMGDGTFEDVSDRFGSEPNHWSSSVAWCDLNRDGALDLYVVNYVLDAEKTCRTPTGELAACSPGNFDGESDLVFLNSGDGSFQRLDLAKAGLEASDGKGLGVLVIDLDDDGWQDIYVTNDGTPNYLFRHTGQVVDGIPRFIESGFVSGAALSGDGRSQAGMGICVGDFSGSGRFDLYATNFFNDYNTLYRNQGDCQFEDVTRAAGLVEPTMSLLGFGTQAIDFNGDGWQDILVANGHIDDFSSTGVPWKMPLQLFQNLAGAGWKDTQTTAGSVFAEKALGRAVSAIDWNRDMRPDAVVVFQDRPVALLTNQSAESPASFVLRLVGTTSNRDAIGARVTVESGGRTQTRELAGGDGYFSTNDRRIIVGLGAAPQVDRLKVQWADGSSQEWSNIPSQSSWTIRQGSSALYPDRISPLQFQH